MTESKDILLLVLALCALILTGFLAWFLFELIQIFRQVNGTIREIHAVAENVKEKLSSFDRLLEKLHEKIGSGAATLGLIAAAVKDVTAFLKRKRPTKKRDAAAREDE